MTREQWLALCWRDFHHEVLKTIAAKDQRGGQHVPLHNGLMGAAPSALREMERWCRSALNTPAEYYADVPAEHFAPGDAGRDILRPLTPQRMRRR